MATQTQYTHAELMSLWLLAGGSAASADTAAAIAQAESGGCLYAKAGPTDDRPVKTCTYRQTTLENSYGLWQVNRDAHPQYSATMLYTAVGNANAAASISDGGTSFQAWSTYKDGSYRRFLTTSMLSGASSQPVRPHEALDGFASVTHVLAREYPRALRNAAAFRRAARRALR